MLTQLLATAAIIVFTIYVVAVSVLLLRRVGSPQVEKEGADRQIHGEKDETIDKGGADDSGEHQPRP